MAALSGYLSGAFNALSADPAAAAATVTGVGVTYAGFTALDYNKDNFQTDQENRFGRFTTARANMIAQVGQYRFDIRGMTNITVSKCHVYIDTAQLFMCTSAALTCAGRVGMHGAAPPGWLMALYTGNIFIGAMYLTLCIWMGFHCGLRASCGMASLLTRKVRLPIPSLAQINRSRVFGSTYERQRWWDILRFPWVPHPFDAPEIPGASSEEEEDEDPKEKGKAGGKKKKTKSAKTTSMGDYAASEAFGSTGRSSVPSWIRDEQVVDKGTASVPHHVPTPGNKDDLQLHNSADPHDAPDHFKLFMEAQKEWFPYEVYHKIGLLYGVMCFFHAVTYYCVITAMSELRGFWIGWALPGIFMTAQYWLMQLDIFKAHGRQRLKHFEWFGHIAPYFATAACTCEYRFQYSKAQVALGWTFAMASLVSHLLFAFRFYDLMMPDIMDKEMEESDGKSWWPRSWPAPLAFINTLWQLTPPKKLKKGQHDLLHEALNLEVQHGGVCKLRRRRGKDHTKKRTKRATPQNPRALMNQVRDLQDRFAEIYQQVIGKDQVKLTELHGRWHQAREEAKTLIGEGTDSGTESSGSSDGYDKAKGSLSHSQYADKITEVADELNHIEDMLAQLEMTHQVSTKDSGLDPVDAAPSAYSGGVSLESGGTSSRPLPTTPLWIFRFAVMTHIFCWVFIIVCTGVEIVLGNESLAQPPGEPPWIRNNKMRPYQHDKTYLHLSTDPLPSWYRLFVAATMPDPSDHHGGDAHGGDSHGGDSHGGDAQGGDAHGGAGGMGPAAPAAEGSAAAAAGGHSSPAAHSADHSADHASPGHRRLAAGDHRALNDLFSTLPALDWLAQKYLKDESQADWRAAAEAPQGVAGIPTALVKEVQAGTETSTVPATGFMAPSLRALPVDWPPLFEPRHLACQTRATGAAVAAFTSRGFGALLHIQNSSDVAGTSRMKADQFALAGISALGPLVGASWGTSGLHLVTRAGRLLHCPGHVPTDGAWACTPDAGAAVPMSPGAMLRAAAVSEHAAGRTLALLFDDMPTSVVIYKEELSRQAWLPAGEMHLPPGSQRASLSLSKDTLVVALEDGTVHHRPLHDGASPLLFPAPASGVMREWHSACATSPGEKGIIRLSLRQSGPNPATNWVPELVVAAKTGTSSTSTPLLNV